MPAAPFAALEARLNTAVIRRLANAMSVVAGNTVPVIFDNGYAVGNVGVLGMSTSQPSITLQSSEVPAEPIGATVVINATEYLVAVHEPDGTGLSRLVLELAA